MLLHGPAPTFSSLFIHSQTHKYSGRWTEDVNRLSLVKGRDNVSNREPLRSVKGGGEAAGRPAYANTDDKCPLNTSHSATVSED